MKYYRDKSAVRYSMAPDYFEISKKAIDKMFLQVGKNKFDNSGLMTSGVIVRHMMLPGLMYESKKIIDYLYNTYGDDIYMSIMNQFTPMAGMEKYPEIKLHLVLPCPYEDQTTKWDERQKEDFSKIMNAADTIEYTSDTHYKGCMKKRNEKLVEYADCCFCYWDGRYISGTAQTVRLAEKKVSVK